MASYDDSQLLISQINRAADRNPQKALYLILYFAHNFGFYLTLEAAFLKCYQYDLALAAQIVALAPSFLVKQLNTTNETAQWKAYLCQNLEFAMQTDYWVEFDSDDDKFAYFLFNLERKDIKRAFVLLNYLEGNGRYGEVAYLVYRSIVCKRENAFRLIKSKYAEELTGHEQRYYAVSAAWFSAPQASAQAADTLD